MTSRPDRVDDAPAPADTYDTDEPHADGEPTYGTDDHHTDGNQMQLE